MAPAFQDMELPDIPEELIDPTLLTLGRAPFRFRDLAPEIRMQIFQLLKPAESPRPTTEADQAKLFIWASQDVPSESGLYLCKHPWVREARNFLLLNKSTYKDFAPHYYQSSVIRFLDPVTFADDFLANATGACFYNLRFVSCVLNARPALATNIERVEGTRKLADVEFEASVYDHGDVGYEVGDWETIDSEQVKGQLTRLEQHLCATTFRGFKRVRGVKLDDSEPGEALSYVDNISITFIKDPNVPSRVFVYDEADGGTLNKKLVWSAAAAGSSEVSAEDSDGSEDCEDSEDREDSEDSMESV